MNKEHNRYKAIQNYEASDDAVAIFSMDFLAIIFLITGFVLDLIYGDIINDAIIGLSIDSLLTLITIVMALVVPLTDNQSLKDYYINPDDYKRIRKTSNRPYLNLLVVALFIFIINIFLYVFEFRLSLIVTFCISFAYILVYIIPKIYERIKGDDILIKLVSREFASYRQKNKDWCINRQLYAEKDENINSLNRLIEGLIIKRGFTKTFEILTREVDHNSSDYTNIYLYLANLQEKVVSDLIGGNFQYPITDNIIKRCIDNVDECLFSCLDDFSSFDANTQSSISLYLINSLTYIDKMIDADSTFTNLSISLSKVVADLLDAYDKNDFFLSLLYSLLLYSIQNEDIWFVKEVANLTNNDSRVSSRYSYFPVASAFFLMEIVKDSNLDSTFRETLSKLLHKKYKILVRRQRDTLGSGKRFGDNFNSFITNSLKNCLLRSFDFLIEADTNVEIRSFLFDTLEDVIRDTPSILLVLNFGNDLTYLDNQLSKFDQQIMDYLRRSVRSSSRIKHFFSELCSYKMCPPAYGDNMIDNVFKYVRSYPDRIKNLESIKKKIGLTKFEKNLPKIISRQPWFTKEYSSRMYGPSMRHERHISFYISNEEPLINSDGTTNIDINEFVSLLTRRLIPLHNIKTTDIYKYNPSIRDEIDKFDPVYMHAPRFVKYLNKSHSKSSQKLLNVPQRNIQFASPTTYEIFMQKDAFSIFIDLSRLSITLSGITNEDAARHEIGKSQSISPLSSITDDEILNYQKTHSRLDIAFYSQLNYDENKFLVFNLPEEESDEE